VSSVNGRAGHCPQHDDRDDRLPDTRTALGLPARPPDQARTAPEDTAGAATGAAWLILAVVALAGFLGLTVLIASRVAIPFDQPILAFARTLDGLPDVWQALSSSANIPLIVIGVGLVLWLFFTHRRREALIVAVVLIAITAGSEGFKQLVARPRPSGTDPTIPGVVYSYPSGHVLEALTILGIVAIRSWRSGWPLAARVAVWAVVIAWVLLVGLARIAINVHYPTDVLAGLLFALGVLGIYGWLTRPGRDRPRRRAA
jgi:membrane-associated phospholipid phosphatase